MNRYRVRSSFLNFDRTFDSIDEIASYVNSKQEEDLLKEDEIRNHFVDKQVPFFGVKGIIITREVSNQEISINKDDKLSGMI